MILNPTDRHGSENFRITWHDINKRETSVQFILRLRQQATLRKSAVESIHCTYLFHVLPVASVDDSRSMTADYSGLRFNAIAFKVQRNKMSRRALACGCPGDCKTLKRWASGTCFVVFRSADVKRCYFRGAKGDFQP